MLTKPITCGLALLCLFAESARCQAQSGLDALVGDGVADDSAALQAMLDQGDVVELPAGVFLVTRTLIVRSGSQVRGQGRRTTIVGGFNAPIIASAKFRDADASLRGGTVVERLSLVGSSNPDDAENHGIVLIDYYSVLRDIEIRSVGGSGVVLQALETVAASAGNRPTTLVENRLENIAVRGSHHTSFVLGERGNRQLTDGYFYGCVSQVTESIEAHAFIGSAGGWRIRDFHGYGRGQVREGMVIAGGFRTRIDGVHLQSFSQVGLNLVSTQEAVFIDALSFATGDNEPDAIALRVGRAAGYMPDVIVTGIAVSKRAGDNPLVPVWAASNTRVRLATGISRNGERAGLITEPAGPGAIEAWKPALE